MSGGFRQVGSVGKGDGVTSEGNEVIFEFFTTKNAVVAKIDLYKNSNSDTTLAHSSPDIADDNNITIEPDGKYYALLIGNSNYVNWASLTSPKNDVNEIKKILQKNYEF